MGHWIKSGTEKEEVQKSQKHIQLSKQRGTPSLQCQKFKGLKHLYKDLEYCVAVLLSIVEGLLQDILKWNGQSLAYLIKTARESRAIALQCFSALLYASWNDDDDECIDYHPETKDEGYRRAGIKSGNSQLTKNLLLTSMKCSLKTHYYISTPRGANHKVICTNLECTKLFLLCMFLDMIQHPIFTNIQQWENHHYHHHLVPSIQQRLVPIYLQPALSLAHTVHLS